MISSPTDLCNLALGHLGEGRITSLDEDTAAARACALHYSLTRDEMLRSHRWNFATKRAELSRLADAPLFGWEYAYQLPSDFLRALEVNESEAGDFISEEWKIEGHNLLTDAEEVQLIYIAQVVDEGLFDSLFVQAFALKLAVVLSETIHGTTGKTAELMQAYTSVMAPLARRVDANEGRRRKGLLPLNSLFVRARGEGL